MNEYSLLQYAGVPTRIQKSLQLYEANLAEKSIEFADSLYLYGKAGSGKSTLAAYLLLQAIKKKYHMPSLLEHAEQDMQEGKTHQPIFNEYFISVSKLLQSLRQSYSQNNSGPTEQQIFDRCTRSGLLVLDDFGTGRTTDWAFQTLYVIIDHRYGEMLPTIITSNLDFEQLGQDVADERMVSRIMETYKRVKMSGDYRLAAEK